MDAPLDELLSSNRLLQLAIETRSGPHVTPQAYTWWGGRLWIVIFRDALKRDILEKRPRAGILVEDGERTLIGVADAVLLDPLNPLSLAMGLPESLTWGLAAASWVRTNIPNVVGYVRDFLDGEMPDVIYPHKRLLVALRPRALAVSEGDELRSWGGWDEGDVPRAAHDAEPGGIPAIAAIDTPNGPVPLPCLYDTAERRAYVDRELYARTGALRQPRIAVAVIGPFEDRPSENRGALLRGTAVAYAAGSEHVLLEVDAEKKTSWRGAEAKTVSVSGPR